MTLEKLKNARAYFQKALDMVEDGLPFKIVPGESTKEALTEAVSCLKSEITRRKASGDAGRRRRKPDSEVSQKALYQRRWRENLKKRG